MNSGCSILSLYFVVLFLGFFLRQQNKVTVTLIKSTSELEEDYPQSHKTTGLI